MMSKAIKGFKNWWQFYNLSPEERWLAESGNIAELEHRLRRLQTHTDRLIFTQYGG